MLSFVIWTSERVPTSGAFDTKFAIFPVVKRSTSGMSIAMPVVSVAADMFTMSAVVASLSMSNEMPS